MPADDLVENLAPTADIADASAAADRGHDRFSVRQQRRRQNRRLATLAILLAVSFVVTALWSRGTFTTDRDAQTLAIAPAVLFEQLCADVGRDAGTAFHVSDFVVDDTMVPQLAQLDTIETLIFDRGAVSDVSMKTIAALPNLHQLRLRLSPIGDEGLKELTRSSSLRFLNLPHANCTAAAIGQLAAIPQLRQLRVGSPKLSNDVAREIAKIKTLRMIHLIGVPITDEGLKILADMPQLESLYLDDAAVTEAGWNWLFSERTHLHVHINQHHHDRDPKAHRHHDQ